MFGLVQRDDRRFRLLCFVNDRGRLNRKFGRLDHLGALIAPGIGNHDRKVRQDCRCETKNPRVPAVGLHERHERKAHHPNGHRYGVLSHAVLSLGLGGLRQRGERGRALRPSHSDLLMMVPAYAGLGTTAQILGSQCPSWVSIRGMGRLVQSFALTDGDPMTTDHVVLVTGGNRGIGRAIAERFVRDGYKVAVTARSGEGPEGTLTVRADVTDAAAVDAAFTEVEKALGPVGIVVANAGINKDTLLMRMSEDDFDSVISTNVGGTFRVVKRASKNMLRARFGRVILISSVVGLYGSAGQVNYAASKSALVGFARSLTRELGARNITANVVAPGFIETDMTAALPEETQKQYLQNIPAGRFATADEVAGVVAWLASDDATYISGAVIPVDGGLGMGH